MREKLVAVILALVFCFGLTGCGENQIPEMTDEELQAVGEYAAITLMKYDASNRSRLVELPEESTPTAPEVSEPDSEQEKPSGMGPVDDTPIVNPGGKGIDNSYTMEEVMELPEGVSVNYLGYELCASYPHDAGNDFFALSAVQGKQLLIIQFSIENHSGQEQKIDLLSNGVTYRMTLNGKDTRQALMTMLLNDMSTYADDISDGDSEQVVLVFEVNEMTETDISEIRLNLKNESKTYTIQLF